MTFFRANQVAVQGLRKMMASALLATTSLAAGAIMAPGMAHARAAHSYNIPAGSLAMALNRFAEASDIKLFYNSALAKGLSCAGLEGNFSTADALSRLLAGTGLTFRQSGPGAFTIERVPQTADGAIPLGPVRVEADTASADDHRWLSEVANGPVTGIVAHRTATGVKTDTPVIEVPQSISIVAREQMDRQGATSVTEVLRYVPGVTVETYGPDPKGYDWVYMRGFNAQSSSDFRDGLRQSSVSYSFFRTEPYALERVEVLRGPSSTLYGQSDAGGLINRISKRPPEAAHLEIVLEGGSYDRFQAAADLGGPLNGDGTVLYQIIGVARDANTQFAYPSGQDRKENRLFIAPSLSWRPSDWTTLNLYGEVLSDRSGGTILTIKVPGAERIPVGDPNFDRASQDQQTIGYELTHKLNDVWTLRQNARFGHTDFSLNVLHTVGISPAGLVRRARRFDEKMDAFVIDNQAEAKFTTGALSHQLLLGIDANYSNADVRMAQSFNVPALNPFAPVYGVTIADPRDVGTLPTNYNQEVEQAGLYLQEQAKFDDRWILTAGGRLDHLRVKTDNYAANSRYRRNDTQFSGRVGLTYLTLVGIAPYASYSEAFVPNLGLSPTGETFKPSTSRQWEAGIKYEPRGINALFTAAVFDLKKSNALSYSSIDGGNIAIGKTRARGVELEGKISLPYGFDLNGSYTYTDVEVLRSAQGNVGKRPMLAPAHTASGWFNYAVPAGPLKGLGAGVGVRYVGKTWGDAANTVEVPAWTVFDAGVRYALDNVTFSVNATNLFDKHYFATCEDDTSCYEGQRRTIIGRIKFGF